MGTNPIAWAAPRKKGEEPVCLDIATSSVAEGKLRVARAKGDALAPGQILNREGRPSLDPNDFYDGGALLPFGAHKGSGLSILAQVLGVGLAAATGFDYAALREPDALARAVRDPRLARRAKVPTDLWWVPALGALLLLAWYFRPAIGAVRRARA